MRGLEVEIKALVGNRPEFSACLEALATFVRSYNKEDWYYGVREELPETRFRLRRDADTHVCTHKQKTVRDGIEQSVETEFSVSDGDAFDRFARHLGFECLFVKRKTGERWIIEDLTLEVSDVNDLGTFVEIELILPTDASDGEIERSRDRVRTMLQRLAIPQSAIEERTYTQMIHEKLSSLTNT